MRILSLSISTLAFLAIAIAVDATSEEIIHWPFNTDVGTEASVGSANKVCTGYSETPSTSDEVLCSDLNYLQYQYDNMRLAYAERLFNVWFGQLKLGFGVEHGGSTSLVAHTAELERGLETVRKTIQNIKFPGELPRRIAFATTMFQVLRDCTRFMNCYADMPLDGHDLVYLIIEAYAEVMTMHDAWGNLDKSIPRYSEKLCNLRARIARLEADMDALPDVSLLIYIMFRDQRNRAKRVIEVLLKQLPPLISCD